MERAGGGGFRLGEGEGEGGGEEGANHEGASDCSGAALHMAAEHLSKWRV
jgi:hypothetical protein